MQYDWLKLPEEQRRKIIADVESDWKHMPDRYWVTELCGCLSETFYNRKLGRKKLDPNNVNDIQRAYYFWRGKMHDQRLSEPFAFKQLSCMIRVPDIPITISGKADIYWESARKIIELKTIKTLYYKDKDGAPSEEHRKQALFYAYNLTPQADGVDIHYWDFEGVRCFTVSTKNAIDVINWFMDRARKLYAALETDVAPDICVSETWEGKKCVHCEYKERCKREHGIELVS